VSLDRRGFLKLFGAAAAIAAVDPEFLLWRPGAKTIFLPPVRVVDPATGISMRFVRAWNPLEAKMVNRVDAMMMPVPEWAAPIFNDPLMAVEEWRTMKAPSLDHAVNFMTHKQFPSAFNIEHAEFVKTAMRERLRPGEIVNVSW
jgi:hypothetical protein